MGKIERVSAYISADDIDWLRENANAGMSYRDMAEGLNRPMGTVKNMLFRLRRDGLVARRYIDWTSKELPCD
jgi:predicted transcriptional regulator